jgi:hypothetical protein
MGCRIRLLCMLQAGISLRSSKRRLRLVVFDVHGMYSLTTTHGIAMES